MTIKAMRRERLDRKIKVRSEGLYAIFSWKEVAYLLVPRMVFIVGLLIAPLVLPGLYWQRVLCTVGAYVLLSLSFVVLLCSPKPFCLLSVFSAVVHMLLSPFFRLICFSHYFWAAFFSLGFHGLILL